jgi:hypothetical protein
MPLTPAHAAAALPLSRVRPRLPLAALVVGTMAPDFEYLLRLAPRGRFGHSPLGLIAFCLPAGLLVHLAYERVVRPALVGLLPPGVATAAGPERRAGLVAAALALLLGALSHVAWDGFTHDSGWAVARLPGLREQVAPAAIPGLRWYTLLQHASTLVGLAVVLAWGGRWLRRLPAGARRYAPAQGARSARTALALLSVAALAGLANGARALSASAPVLLGYAAVGAMSGLAVAAFAYGVWVASRRGVPGVAPTTWRR